MKRSKYRILDQVETLKSKLMALHEDALDSFRDEYKACISMERFMRELELFQQQIEKHEK